MKDFVLLFRRPDTNDGTAPESEIQAKLQKWDDWFGGIAAQGRLVNMGIRLGEQGNVLKAGGMITDGPFVEIRPSCMNNVRTHPILNEGRFSF
jgi:hypothetical protein